MFGRNINQNVCCDINNLPSSNNDVLNDIDPDINNLIPNCIQNQCKSYDTSSELRKDICFQNNIAMLHRNICSSIKKNLRLYLLYRQFKHHLHFHRIKWNMSIKNLSRSTWNSGVYPWTMPSYE